MFRKIILSKIACIKSLEIIGDYDLQINGLNLCNRKSEYNNILTYVTNENYTEIINSNLSIKCVIIKKSNLKSYLEKTNRSDISYLLSDNPEKDFYMIHDYLLQKTDFYEKYEFQSSIGKECNIHPTAYIDHGVIIGDYVSIGANTVVNRGTIIGNDVTIGCNTVVGSEGFQIIKENGVPKNIKHLGKTHISNNVYIGDNTAVCNSLFEGETFVGENAKIDNLVQIAHNCYVGKNAVVTAGVILCGSSIVQDSAWIGVNSSILNKVTIGENAVVGIGSVVTRNVPSGLTVYGVPAKAKTI